MSGTPFFSVIIPTFNRADLLAKAIQSVLDQTFTDWELIVIDDGSTDHTASVVKSFEDGRIGYYYQENSGKSVSRNHGIELSKGLYISFLDDDDYLLEIFFETFEKSIIEFDKPVAFFMCNEYVKTFENKVILNKIPIKHLGNPTLMLWKMQSSIRPFAIHQKIFENLRFNTNCPFGQDFHLIIQISLHYPLYYLPFTGCVNVQHLTTGTRKKFISDLRNNAFYSIDCLEDLLIKQPELFKRIPEKTIFSQKNHILYGFASAAMKSGDFDLFFNLVRKFELKDTNYKSIYYLISLYTRLPFYYILNLFKNKLSERNME